MSTHNIGFYEAILMRTHNIGFYEDLTKIIFELSANIIKYAPYFFCWGCDNIGVYSSIIVWFAGIFITSQKHVHGMKTPLHPTFIK